MPPLRRSLVLLLSIWTAINLVGTVMLWHDRGAHADSAAEGGTHTGHAATPDDRRAVVLPAPARDAVLEEMRTMLGSIQGIAAAAAAGDTAAMRRAVQPSGMAMAADHAIEELLPPDWLAMAMATHRAFDSMPLRASSPAATFTALAELTAGCNGCHAMYRIDR